MNKLTYIEATDRIWNDYFAGPNPSTNKITMTMSKDIKDFIHLYLGCEVSILCFKDYSGGTYKLTGKIFANIVDNYDPAKDTIKPILRPLSDMTEEEGKEWADLKERCWDNYKLPLQGIGQMAHWLLSKHFDLFGLIESGLAIDKTKLNP